VTRVRRAIGALALTVAVLVSGCTFDGTPPSESPTPVERPFTVMTTDRVLTADPAAVADNGSQLLVTNVFQTLMTSDPGASVLKPDAARDCIVEPAGTYRCTLNEDLRFHNGHLLDAAAVKFSIDRAMRLDVAGSSAGLLSSIRRVDTPDARTVRFILSREDTQIGWALAAPAAAIVDPALYSPDRIQALDEPIVGSGPFGVSSVTDTELQLARFPDYIGRNTAQLPALVVRTMPDSGSIEEAMANHVVEVVWRGLSAAALTRFGMQLDQADRTNDGFALTRLTGARVRMLQWGSTSPRRSNAALRTAISGALQDDRTLDSLVPVGVVGRTSAFAAGGTGHVAVSWDRRIALTLGYDPTMPDGLDQANMVRTRLEIMGGVSVRLVEVDGAGTPATDLRLVDRKAWTWTAIAWLQPYLSQPAPRSAEQVQSLDAEFRRTTVEPTAVQLLARLQEAAAADAVVLPISQSDEQMFVAQGVRVSETSYGPAYQLGLWGLTR